MAVSIFERSNSSITILLEALHELLCGRGGLMVNVLDSRSNGPGSSPGRGHCVVFLGKTLYSHSASFHPGLGCSKGG